MFLMKYLDSYYTCLCVIICALMQTLNNGGCMAGTGLFAIMANC